MSQPNQSDEWLMGQVTLGKREYLEALVRRYASPLLTYIERMVGDRHRSEELVQEVFLRVWIKRQTYKFPKIFRPWLFTIATNHCRSAFRRAKPRAEPLSEYGEQVPVAVGPSPVDAAVRTETAGLVAAAVAQLPAQQRMVVTLRSFNGLSFAEIAQAIGRNEITARSHMHHALCRMRRYLEPRMRE